MVIIIIDYDNDDDSLPTIIARLRFSRIPSANWPYPTPYGGTWLGLGWVRPT